MPELLPSALLLIACTAGAASFMHGAAGFGGALVAMPIYTVLLPLEVATPLQATHGVIMTAIMLVRMRGEADVRDAMGMILGTVIGLPFGILLLSSVDASFLLKPLGGLLVLQAVYSLFFAPPPDNIDRPETHHSAKRIGSWIAGYFGGVFGGAFAVNGPPVVLYAVMKRWPKDHFRATLQPYFLANNAFICIGLAFSGLLTMPVLRVSLIALPGAVIGLWLGFKLGARINPEPFRRAVLVLVLILGATLFFR